MDHQVISQDPLGTYHQFIKKNLLMVGFVVIKEHLPDLFVTNYHLVGFVVMKNHLVNLIVMMEYLVGLIAAKNH